MQVVLILCASWLTTSASRYGSSLPSTRLLRGWWCSSSSAARGESLGVGTASSPILAWSSLPPATPHPSSRRATRSLASAPRPKAAPRCLMKSSVIPTPIVRKRWPPPRPLPLKKDRSSSRHPNRFPRDSNPSLRKCLVRPWPVKNILLSISLSCMYVLL